MGSTGTEWALVTGASAGIGRAAAAALARAGYAVVATARRAELVEELAAELKSEGLAATAAAVDVTDGAAARSCVAEHAERHGGPAAVLVNNAGSIGPIASLADADPDEFARCVATNLTGAWNMMAAVLPGMVGAGGGAIVNLSSGAAANAMEGWSAYCSSKAGLAMLTRMVELEYAEAGVCCYGLRPGLVATAMQDTIRASGVNRVSKVPKSDMLAPEHVAQAVVYLARERPERWRGGEPDVRDPDFQKDAGLAAA